MADTNEDSTTTHLQLSPSQRHTLHRSYVLHVSHRNTIYIRSFPAIPGEDFKFKFSSQVNVAGRRDPPHILVDILCSLSGKLFSASEWANASYIPIDNKTRSNLDSTTVTEGHDHLGEESNVKDIYSA